MGRESYHSIFTRIRENRKVSDHGYTCDCYECKIATRLAEQEMRNQDPYEPRAEVFCDSFGSINDDDY